MNAIETNKLTKSYGKSRGINDLMLTVEEGDVKRIEYISGTAAARLTKEGGGTLEVAIVGNTNASFFVNGGELKFVRPGRLALDVDACVTKRDVQARASVRRRCALNERGVQIRADGGARAVRCQPVHGVGGRIARRDCHRAGHSARHDVSGPPAATLKCLV